MLLYLLLRRLTPCCSCRLAFFLASGAFSCRVGLGISKSTNKFKALSPHCLSHSICPGLNKELQVSLRVWCAPLNAHDIQQKGPAVHLSAECTGVAVFRCALELLQSGEKWLFFFPGSCLILARFHGLLVSTCSRSTPNSAELQHPSLWSLVLSFFMKPGQQFCFMFYQLQHPDGIASDFLHGWDCGLDRHHVHLWDLQGGSVLGGWGGGNYRRRNFSHVSVQSSRRGKTDTHECGRQCQIFKTKNKSFENWKSEVICILPCLKSGIVGDFI